MRFRSFQANLPVRFARERNGAVLVVVALLLFVLVGAIALSVDLGRAWNLDTQLQDAADACALSAASQLDNTPGSRARAIQACLNLIENRQSFATDAGGAGVVQLDPDLNPDDNDDFDFYLDLGDGTPGSAVLASGDADADFVRVHVQSREVGFFFAAAVGAVSSAEPDAWAVAGLTIAQCQNQPMFFCNPYDDGNNPPFDISSTTLDPPPDFAGVSIVLDQGGQGTGNPSWEPGNFGLLGVPDCSGKACLYRQIWQVNPEAQCFGNFVATETGQATNLRNAFNVRFDIYAGSSGSLDDKVNAIPARNTVKGLKKGPDPADCAISSGGWVKGANPYTGTYDPLNPPEVMGYPRDNCQFMGSGPCTAPGSPPNPGDRFGDGTWDWEAYWKVNHFGDTYNGQLNGPGGIPTRHDMYLWEKDNPPWDGGPEGDSQGGTVCNTVTPMPDPPSPDRRSLRVAVLNCKSAVHDCDISAGESPGSLNCKKISDGGKFKNVTLASPDGWIHMFLLEPMGVWDSDGDGKDNNDFVAEVVDPGSTSATLDDPTNKYIVQLYPLPK